MGTAPAPRRGSPPPASASTGFSSPRSPPADGRTSPIARTSCHCSCRRPTRTAVSHVLAHPEVRARILGELRETGPAPLDPQRVTRLEYLDAVCRETLRLTPIIPLVGRRLTRPMRIGGIDLPAGAVAAPCIYLAHSRPERWPEPERFRPERFLGSKPTPYEFLPFGGGVRRCLGMAFALVEMKIVLGEVLTRVELRAAPGYQVRVVRRSVTLAPSEGMPVVVESRAA